MHGEPPGQLAFEHRASGDFLQQPGTLPTQSAFVVHPFAQNETPALVSCQHSPALQFCLPPTHLVQL